MIFLHKFVVYALFLSAMGLSTAALAASGADRGDEQIVNNLLETMIAGDYQRFIAYGTPAFGELTGQQFDSVAAQVGPRLKQGYELEYFGMLQQQGLDISVWKITFSDNGDDLLATLNVRNGKVGGFFLR